MTQAPRNKFIANRCMQCAQILLANETFFFDALSSSKFFFKQILNSKTFLQQSDGFRLISAWFSYSTTTLELFKCSCGHLPTILWRVGCRPEFIINVDRSMYTTMDSTCKVPWLLPKKILYGTTEYVR